MYAGTVVEQIAWIAQALSIRGRRAVEVPGLPLST
jgi:hypothetical protein